ncbi:MAG TPA: hypothetical protein DD490_04385 [Acidobacteria bacterium]|nr:hypothetical protein [Acidobacteriota bacterium]
MDPLPAELARASALLAGSPPSIREANAPILQRAEEDVRQGRRQLAVQRLVNLHTEVAATAYRSGVPTAQREQMASLDAEWKRLGTELASDLAPATPGLFDGVAAAPRALAEAARAQVRGYYQSGLEYAHATMADQGFYYLGEVMGKRETVSFCRKFPAPAGLPQPPLRAIRPELEALENDMVAVYRPPLSIQRHGEFIEAGSSLKEARELDAAGQRYGALLRYLQAAQLFAPLRPDAPAPLAAEALAGKLREHAERLKADGMDHSLGEMFLQLAQAEAAGSPATASVLATDVLPRYFAALAPAIPEAPRPAPQLAVTLVRWPYT